MPRVQGCEAVYDVADQWRDRCLLDNKSLLWPDLEEPTWTVENIEAAQAAYRRAPEYGGDSWERLFSEIASEPSAVRRVMADVLAVWNLGSWFPIKTKWSWLASVSPPDQPIAPESGVGALVNQAFEQRESAGIDLGNVANLRTSQIFLYLEFAKRVKSEPDANSDPNIGREIAFDATQSVDYSVAGAHSLLHLLFPEQFEALRKSNKQKIVRGFDGWAPRDDLVLEDRLRSLRDQISTSIGRADFQFWDQDVLPFWQPDETGSKEIEYFIDDDAGFINWVDDHPDGFILNTRRKPVPHDLVLHRSGCPHFDLTGAVRLTDSYTKACSRDDQSLLNWAVGQAGSNAQVRSCTTCKPNPDVQRQRFWKISPGADGSKWDEFRTIEQVAIDFGARFNLESMNQQGFEAFKTDLSEALANTKSPYEVAPAAKALWTFLKEIAIGDKVVAYSEKQVFGLGTITGEYFYKDGPDSFHRRKVEWSSTESLSSESLAQSIQAKLKQRSTLVELTEDEFNQISLAVNGRSNPTKSEIQLLTYFEPREIIQIDSLLRDKKQLIFEGPPGCGKTFLADLFARYLTGNPLTGEHDNRMEFVQFHQSYGYEDFVQGIRPRTDPATGHLRYDVQDGIFLQMCDRARNDHDNAYVLVIDEINRGNLSRIFGELMMALEYRDKKVKLSYGSGDGPDETAYLTIPENLYLIGTMNSTDRSLAMIDYALRRRFYFYPLRPVINDRAPVLEKWLATRPFDAATRDQILHWFLRINKRVIEHHGDDFQVGHSYFMTSKIDTPEKQHQIWQFALKPLLDEYYHGNKQKEAALAEIGPKSIRLEFADQSTDGSQTLTAQSADDV